VPGASGGPPLQRWGSVEGRLVEGVYLPIIIGVAVAVILLVADLGAVGRVERGLVRGVHVAVAP